MRFRVAVPFLFLLVTGLAQGQWSGQFARSPELNIQAFAETPEGFVAAGVPLQFINEAGDVEYHVLRFYENGRWRTDGDIGVGILSSGSITSVVPYRQDVCVGGGFVNFSPGGFNFLACYSPASGLWYQPGGNGNGPNGAVNSVWFDGATNLYIGGDFTEVLDDQGAPITANRVARTTGAVWEPLTGDGGATNGVAAPVKVVRTFNGFVFVASGSSVFRYNPTNTTWTPFGLASQNLIPQTVDDLAFYSSEVIAAGPYDNIGGVAAPGIASSSVATGPDWLPLDDGSQGHGSGEPRMAANSSYIYTLGPWPDLGGADGLARWTGFVWEAVDTRVLGDNVSGTLREIATQPEQDLCVLHGGFTNAQIASAGVVCKDEPAGLWRGTSQGIEGSAAVLAHYGGEVYAGGGFLSAGDDAGASVVARWDGSRWSAVGGGVTGTVSSLEVFQGELYAAGNVTGAGGSATGGLVAWDGASWRDAGGAGVVASELHALGDSLYFFGVGGNCGTVLSRVCRFDGSTIEEAASGLPEPVSVTDIDQYQGQLVVAGNFRLTGGARQDAIAVLENGSWNIIVSSFAGGGVLTMASDANFLYFGGQFANVTSAAETLSRVGRWDGSSLSALGSGLEGGAAFTRALAIRLHEGRVFVAGDFSSAGGALARGIAAWDGVAWDGLEGGMIQTPFPGTGSGMAVPGVGEALLSTSTGLYVGGSFDQIGDKFSAGIALLIGDTVFASSFEDP